jgi:cation transporter family protein
MTRNRFSFRYLLIIALHALLFSLDDVSVDASQAMKRLYEDLFTDYNRLILPIATNKTKVTVTVGLKLGQILDLNLKQQILSTNVWVEQTWHDHRLQWDPASYGGIDMVHVPAENIWIPDIVLFNNADGNYELTLIAKAVLYSDGTVVWKPPTMFRSTCEIDVEYFPFDIQTCFLRFGSWTYAGDEVDIKHFGNKRKVDIGIDLSQFYKNVEWDIIDVPAYYNEVKYDGHSEPFQDITFKIVIRRKMLFYLVNLILPVALMTFMTVSVFYLPADSNEKVTLSISILTSLIVFFLLMLEVIPPTSLAVPLFGKYLLFTLVLVSLSACVSVYVLNIYHRAPSVHQMSPRMRQLFLKTLPGLLHLDQPDPRERSSLNRFRKKKIAQQILQARQNNKVYDLAQPLAASLNLIETLQKSYDFNPTDDLKKLKTHDDQSEGRYFRRYVDNYIGKLQAEEAANRADTSRAATVGAGKNKARHAGAEHHSKQSTSSSSTKATAAAGGGGGISTRCCNQHNKCCPAANQPIRLSSAVRNNARPTAQSGTCCAMSNQHTATKDPSFDQRTTSFATNPALNDDTFDMTFDYDDQDEAQSPPIVAESDLPSPPPPPRQLAQLSDSMKDLSGRLSSCSQKVGVLASANQGIQLGSDQNEDDGHLVDKLISSINLINNVSDDIDSPTTTSMSNNDQEYQQFKAVSETHQIGPAMHMTTQPLSYPIGMDPILAQTIGSQKQPSTENQCTCNQPMFGDFDMANGSIRNVVHSGCCAAASSQAALNHCNHGGPLDGSCQQQRQMVDEKTNQKQLPRQQSHSQHKPDFLAGTNIQQQERPSELLLSLRLPYDQMPDHVRAAIRSILFIADTIKNEDDENSAIEDWESMSMVVDRLFLWIFFLLCTFGSLIILALAPSLYDQRDSIDDKLRIEIPASNCSAFKS